MLQETNQEMGFENGPGGVSHREPNQHTAEQLLQGLDQKPRSAGRHPAEPSPSAIEENLDPISIEQNSTLGENRFDEAATMLSDHPFIQKGNGNEGEGTSAQTGGMVGGNPTGTVATCGHLLHEETKHDQPDPPPGIPRPFLLALPVRPWKGQ